MDGGNVHMYRISRCVPRVGEALSMGNSFLPRTGGEQDQKQADPSSKRKRE